MQHCLLILKNKVNREQQYNCITCGIVATARYYAKTERRTAYTYTGAKHIRAISPEITTRCFRFHREFIILVESHLVAPRAPYAAKYRVARVHCKGRYTSPHCALFFLYEICYVNRQKTSFEAFSIFIPQQIQLHIASIKHGKCAFGFW